MSLEVQQQEQDTFPLNQSRIRRFFSQMRRSLRRRRIVIEEEEWVVGVGRQRERRRRGGGGGVIPAEHVPIVEEEEDELFEEEVDENFADNEVFPLDQIEDPFRPPRIHPVVQDVIVPPHANLNYSLWMTRDIVQWLYMFYQNETVLDAIVEQQVTGMQLYFCFLDPETAPGWCAAFGINPGAALRIKMVLGRIHNIFYGYED